MDSVHTYNWWIIEAMRRIRFYFKMYNSDQAKFKDLKSEGKLSASVEVG